MVSAIQLHQPTGADVAIKPHRPSKTTTGAIQAPKGISMSATAAIRRGMAISVLYRPRLRIRPINAVPMNPAAPITSRMRDSAQAWTRVTVSRNGRT
ncbi:hypothetical protein D9M69_553370 [compost metagenome]